MVKTKLFMFSLQNGPRNNFMNKKELQLIEFNTVTEQQVLNITTCSRNSLESLTKSIMHLYAPGSANKELHLNSQDAGT